LRTAAIMANVSGDEGIFDRALELLRQEPEQDRPRLNRWAVNEFERAHHIHLSGLIDEEDDYQALGDMLLENPQLGYWLRTGRIDGYINRGSLLNAESFRELIDRLTPIRRAP
jgi:hypothetical protein